MRGELRFWGLYPLLWLAAGAVACLLLWLPHAVGIDRTYCDEFDPLYGDFVGCDPNALMLLEYGALIGGLVVGPLLLIGIVVRIEPGNPGGWLALTARASKRRLRATRLWFAVLPLSYVLLGLIFIGFIGGSAGSTADLCLLHEGPPMWLDIDFGSGGQCRIQLAFIFTISSVAMPVVNAVFFLIAMALLPEKPTSRR